MPLGQPPAGSHATRMPNRVLFAAVPIMTQSRKPNLPGRESDSPAGRPGGPAPKRPQPLHPGLPTGTGLGKYHILERIGTQHNAIIYRARDTMLDRLVAIKQMAPELIDHPIACGHFKREAQFLARIPRGTPGLVAIHELIEDDHGLFIVRQFIRGSRLETLISKRQVGLDGAVRIAETLARGLATLHKLGIVHRGVHPESILVGRGFKPRIDDLGTAAHESDNTLPAVIVSKYAAPELLRGDAYDDRVDIYALGMILFEMCVGRSTLNSLFRDLFADAQATDTCWANWHMNEQSALPDPIDLNPRVPRGLSEVIRKMTAKHLDERVTTMQEVRQVLLKQWGARPDSTQGAMPYQEPHRLPLPQAAQAPPSQSQDRLQPSGGSPSLGLGVTARRPRGELTSTIRVAETLKPSLPAEPARAGLASPDARQHLSRRPAQRRRRRIPTTTAQRMLRIDAVPTPKPVIEIIKARHPQLVLKATVAVVLIGAACLCTGLIWYHYFGPGLTHPIEAVVAEGIDADENGRFATAREKFLEAAQMEVRRKRFTDLQNVAFLRLTLVEAELALARDDFDLAEARLRDGQRRGANPSRIDDLQWRLWDKRDAYRLAEQGLNQLKRGNLIGAELRLDEFERKAESAGLDPSHLRNHIALSRKGRKYAEAMKQSQAALADGDHAEALAACGRAESIKATRDARELRKLILDRKRRAACILRGDEAMRNARFAEALSAFEKANIIEASDDIEAKVRGAGAYLMYHQALEAIESGDLPTAERRLRSSLWKYPTEAAQSKLAKMEAAFDAARLVSKADLKTEQQEYDEAARLYERALPALPPPADASAREKLDKARRAGGAGQRDESISRDD